MWHFLKNHQDFVHIVVSGRAVPFIFIVFLASFAYLFFCINLIIIFLHHRKEILLALLLWWHSINLIISFPHLWKRNLVGIIMIYVNFKRIYNLFIQKHGVFFYLFMSTFEVFGKVLFVLVLYICTINFWVFYLFCCFWYYKCGLLFRYVFCCCLYIKNTLKNQSVHVILC